MKKYLLTLFFILTAASVSKAETIRPIVLAADFGTYLKLTENDKFHPVVFNDDPYAGEKKQVVPPAENDPEKWDVIKDLNNKQKTFSGKASFKAGDGVLVGASAGYTFPEEKKDDEVKFNASYALTVKVEMAL